MRRKVVISICGLAILLIVVVAITAFIVPRAVRFAQHSRICQTGQITPVGWSVDGHEAYYGLDFNPYANIHAVSLDGSNSHIIIPDAFSAKLSPDRMKILATPLSVLTPGANMDTHLLASVSGTTWSWQSIAIPDYGSWSPDSQWILLDNAFSRGGLVKINAATGTSVTITSPTATQKGGDSSPSWSPDGQTIAFSRFDGGWEALYTVNPDGSDLTLLTGTETPPDCQPPTTYWGDTAWMWMPDGKTINFTRRCGDYPQGYEKRLYITPDGQVTDHWGSFSPKAVDFAASPDGQRVLFNFVDGTDSMYIADMDGSDMKLMSTDMLWPIWSPNGQQILFTHYGASDLYVINADGSGMKRLVQTPSRGLCLN